MRAIFHGSAAATLVWLLTMAAPAAAQTQEQQWAWCANKDHASANDKSVGGCTAVIQSGRENPANLAIAYNDRGNAYDDRGDYAHAIADYNEAIRLNPQLAPAYFNRGVSYYDHGDIDRAISDYNEAIRLSPGDAKAYFRRAMAFADQGDFHRAVADSQETLRLRPNDPDYLNALCWDMALDGEDLNQARAACDASLRIRLNDPGTLDTRGLVGLKQSRFQDAWNDYDAAIRADASHASYFYGRGIAARHLGRTGDGQADIARANMLDANIAKTYAGYGVKP